MGSRRGVMLQEGTWGGHTNTQRGAREDTKRGDMTLRGRCRGANVALWGTRDTR